MISTWFETQFPLSVTFKAYDTCVSLEQKVTIQTLGLGLQSQVQNLMLKSVSYFDGVQLKFGYARLTALRNDYQTDQIIQTVI